jgi:glycosyltransferase involved in cell wall biosynthesis
VKILFTRFPLESALGGAEIQTLSLMEGLIAKGHAVAFAGSCSVLLAECKNRGIPTVEWHIGEPPVTKSGALSFAWRRIGMKKKLLQLLANFGRLDAICMLSLSEKLLLTDAALERKATVLWIEHDRVGSWLRKNPWLPVLVRLSKKVVTVPVSHLSGKIYEELGWDSETVKPIPNGIDPDRVMVRRAHHDKQSVTVPSALRLRLEESSTKGDSALKLLCIARLSHEKGVDVLIEALAGTSDDVMLEIIGQGKEEAALRAQTKSLGLENRIIFTPHEDDVAAAYCRSDALILPSRDNDPFGLVAAEAMMLGLPVIVTDQCGIAGYLTHEKDAMIVKADSPTELKQAIDKIKNEELRMKNSMAGQKTAQKLFTAQRMVEAYEELCQA